VVMATSITGRDAHHLGGPLAMGVWRASTISDAWISRTATSLTNLVRASDSVSRGQYNGTACELGVAVRWQWIILPACLVLVSVLLLVATTIRTARYPDMGVENDSPLALLLFELDDAIKTRAWNHAEPRSEPEQRIRYARIRIMVDNDETRKVREG
jgi:hypothetical protein